MVILVCGFILSCQDSKKEEQSETTESSESVEQTTTEKPAETTEAKTEVETKTTEASGFNYSVNYPNDSELAGEVDSTIKNLIANHPGLESDFEKAYGYAVFPKITKAGLGIGGAGGKGLVLENDKVIGLTKLSQATIGLQAGGQQYSQVMFFEDKAALDKFTNGKFKFSSEASAVALKAGASAEIAYNEGIATVIESEKGAMAEASLGTQKFKFEGM